MSIRLADRTWPSGAFGTVGQCAEIQKSPRVLTHVGLRKSTFPRSVLVGRGREHTGPASERVGRLRWPDVPGSPDPTQRRRPVLSGGRRRSDSSPATSRRRGRTGGACGVARQAFDQEVVQALGAGPGDPLHGSHDAGGHRHDRQGRGAVREGGASGSDRTRRSRPSPPCVSTRSSFRSRPSSSRVPACTSRASPARSRPGSARSTPGSARSPRSCELGADEVDIVLNRSLFLGGRYARGVRRARGAREAAGAAHLKVILETGELGSYDRVRQASMLAMAAGADFIKTSTGKIGIGATLPSALCMMEAARDFHRSDRRRGRHQGGGRGPRRRSSRSSTSRSCTRRSAPTG